MASASTFFSLQDPSAGVRSAGGSGRGTHARGRGGNFLLGFGIEKPQSGGIFQDFS